MRPLFAIVPLAVLLGTVGQAPATEDAAPAQPLAGHAAQTTAVAQPLLDDPLTDHWPSMAASWLATPLRAAAAP